jgi:hypothetical protein
MKYSVHVAAQFSNLIFACLMLCQMLQTICSNNTYVLQTYGNEPLSAMVAWLRHTARQLGHQSPLEPPLLATMENHTYQEVQL